VPDAMQVRVHIAGVEHALVGITPIGRAHQLLVVLSPTVSPGQVPLMLSVAGRNSQPYYIPVSK
jgi:hypothetical protein